MPGPSRKRNLPLFTEAELDECWPIVLEGAQQFNGGYFFEAHETWEDVWYQTPLPARTFLQGLIQIAAAFVHFARHEYLGTVRLLAHALRKLEAFSPEYRGIDVERLVGDLRSARAGLTALGAERFREWDSDAIPRIHAGLQ